MLAPLKPQVKIRIVTAENLKSLLREKIVAVTVYLFLIIKPTQIVKGSSTIETKA